ncbi:MAG: radical SAM protein [Bacilli bacterium]|nr:radical SAM protein [Bacilli bacterium]
MKWSMFIIKVESENEILLYNTYNEALVIIEKKEYEDINSFLKGKCILKEDKIYKQLKKLEFLIPSDLNEEENFLKALKQEWADDRHMTLHILPTTACNFDCKYCYQSGIEKDKFLKEKEVKQVIEYIKTFIAERKIEKATIVIHGGEPTIWWKPIEKLLPEFDDLLTSQGIDYKLQIVSNGYNLTSEKADLLAKYNWTRFQVTLDGIKTIHDGRRRLKAGGSSYDKIVSNIDYIIKNKYLKKVSIRINYDMENYNQVEPFLKEIKKIFKTKNVALSLGLITNTMEETEANA